MIRSVVLAEAAREDIENARRWYRARNEALGRDFARAVRSAIASVGQFPERHPLAHQNVRRALLRRFPYMLLYVIGPDAILIVGCWHTHRDPRSWRNRLG